MALVDLILRLQKGEPLTNQEMDNNLSNLATGVDRSSCDWAGPEPANTVPFMTWADTASGLLKRRNAANTAWVVEGKLFVDSTAPATESDLGLLKIATTAESQALTADDVALTPKKLADAFGGSNQSFSASGYQKLPGGLILQWGKKAGGVSGTDFTTFPIAFPNSCIGAVASMFDTTVANQDLSLHIIACTTTTISVSKLYVSDGGYVGEAVQGWSYIALGY